MSMVSLSMSIGKKHHTLNQSLGFIIYKGSSEFKKVCQSNFNAGAERAVGLFKRLGWSPTSDIIEQRKLCIMHNITHGKCSDYFNHYIRYVKYRHHYTTRAPANMDLSTPFFSTMTSKCSFLASSTRLWNNQDSTTRGLTSLCKFKNQLYKKYIERNSRVNNFTISRNFKLIFNF